MTPLSNDDAARSRQLSNLHRGRPGARPPAPPAGNDRARTHGAYGAIARERLDEKTREVFDALATDAPVHGYDGGLPAADAPMVRLLATVLCRIENIERYLEAHGYLTDDGDPRPVLELEGRLRREAADYLDALGMTPRSRAKLGLDQARSFDLARHWSDDPQPDPDVIDGEAEDA